MEKLIPRMSDGRTGLAAFYPGCEALFYEWFNDPRIYSHMGDIDQFPISIEDCRRYVDSHRKDMFLIVANLEGVWIPIGYAGMFIRARHRVGILRYAIGNLNFLSKGYASSAVKLYLKWGFEESDLEVVTASVIDSNPESKKLLVKTGFSFVGKYSKVRFENGNRYDELLFEISKKDFYEKVH